MKAKANRNQLSQLNHILGECLNVLSWMFPFYSNKSKKLIQVQSAGLAVFWAVFLQETNGPWRQPFPAASIIKAAHLAQITYVITYMWYVICEVWSHKMFSPQACGAPGTGCNLSLPGLFCQLLRRGIQILIIDIYISNNSSANPSVGVSFDNW